MSSVFELLRPDGVLLQQSIKSKKRVLEVLSEVLSRHLEHADFHQTLELLTARERLGSTGLGNGVAIPHCRLPEVTDSACSILTLTKPVDFDAQDGRPVDLFIALVVPEDSQPKHLQYLADVAATLDSTQRVKQLRTSRDPESLRAELARD